MVEAEQRTMEEALELLRQTPSGDVTDALSRFGVVGNMTSIRPARGFEDIRLVGPALTIEIRPKKRTGPRGITPYDIYAASEPGKVVVIAGQGNEMTFTGDNQAHMAQVRGMLGLVIDGGARDVAGIRKLGLPLWFKGAQTKSEHATHEISAYNVPVVAGGTVVNPEDIIVADEDGVVVIPGDLLHEVLGHIESVTSIEEELDQLITRGAPVSEIRELLAKKRATVK